MALTPYVFDPDFALYVGDVTDVLAGLPDESVHCVVTSPPFWGLRDYGTGRWEGGDPQHEHDTQGARGGRGGSGAPGKQTEGAFPSVLAVDECSCGATRVDQQLGLEPTPDAYVQRMVQVFREVRRVLRKDGTCFLNLGDSYASAWACDRRNVVGNGSLENGKREDRPNRLVGGLKEKDLVGIPWRTAFALQADGWFLRSDIIWAKPNPMPESVTDRPTKSHEYLFLLTRSARYYFDADAIREEHTSTRWGGPTITQPPDTKYAEATANGFAGAAEALSRPGREWNAYPNGGRNARSVWEIATQPYPEAHFATFPEELPRRCIAAGCPQDGVVLDPFMGSGTTALVARKLGRRSIGIELNPDYAELAARRLSQLSLLADRGAAPVEPGDGVG